MYLKNILSGFLLQINLIIFGLISSIIVAREFGTEGQGMIAYIMLFITIISNFGHFGILDAIPFFKLFKIKKTIQEVYNSTLNFTIILSVLLIATSFLLRKYNILLVEYDLKVVLIAFLIVGANLIIGVQKGIYIQKQQIYLFNKMSSIINLMRVIFLIILFFFNILNLMIYFLLILTTLIFQVYLGWKYINIKYSFRLNIPLLFNQFKLGILVFLGALFIYLNYKSDQFLINFYLDKEALGIFFIAVSLAELSFIVPKSVSNALTGKLVNTNANKKEVITKTIQYSMLISIIVTIIGVCLSPLISLIYGIEFKEAESVFRLLVLANLFATLGKISAPLALAENHAYIHVCISGATLMINIVLNIFSIPKLGIEGAALSSLASYFIYGVLYFIYLRYSQGINFFSVITINNAEINKLTLLFKSKYRKK